MILQFKVEEPFSVLRLDKFLQSQNHENLYSRTLIEKLIENESVFINSTLCTKKSHLVKINDIIEVSLDNALFKNLSPPQKEDIELNIVYEDEFLAVINKPAGMTVHPGPCNYTGTLVNALLYHFNNLSKIDDLRPGIVHRLDKDTSGLIIITKDNHIHYKMSQLFMNRQVDKTYACICLGVPNPINGTINLPISRQITDRKKMTVSDTGKESITHYNTLIDFQYFSFLQVKLVTGRTHQIRVHMSAKQHPILGDPIYSTLRQIIAQCPAKKQQALKQFISSISHPLMLHSWRLRFIHPKTRQEILVNSELPANMKQCLDFLKEHFEYYEYQ